MTPAKIYKINPSARTKADAAATSWIYEHLAAAIECRPPTPTRRAGLRVRMLAHLREFARNNFLTVRATDGEWRVFAPGVSIKLLRGDTIKDNMTAFIRMQPGAVLDSHVHVQPEECLILEGEIFIGPQRLSAGDMHVAAAGTIHPSITSPLGALMVVHAQLSANP